MSDYRADLRKELVQYQDDIKTFADGDFARIAKVTLDLLRRYNKDPEDSWAARENFFRTLYQINDDYYQQYQARHASIKKKVMGFFGAYKKPEKEFLKIQESLMSLASHAEKKMKSVWCEDWDAAQLSYDYSIAKCDPVNYLSGPATRHHDELRVALYSHRLMRDKRFSQDEYGHFHGLPFELSAYKLKRDVEKFIQLYGASLSLPQQTNLAECVSALERFLKIKTWMVYSKFLKNYNASENSDAYHPGYSQRFGDICFRVHHALDQLNPGERLLLPHGYFSEKSGHAALVEFERQTNGKLKISFINTGAGVDGQKRGFWNKLKLNVFGILHISYVDDVDDKAIWDKKLVEKIFDPIVSPKDDRDEAEHAMNLAVNCFGDALKQTDHTINMQINGTCAFSCWIEWLGWRLDPEVFQLLDLFINARALEKLDHFHCDQQVAPDLKKGIPELYKAGEELIEKNKRDLADWLDKNRDHQMWQAIRAIAKTMHVEVGDYQKTLMQKMEEDHRETMRMLDDAFGIERDERMDAVPSSCGLFAKVAAGAVVVGAAAMYAYTL